jgi:HlyD family secretion protein
MKKKRVFVVIAAAAVVAVVVWLTVFRGGRSLAALRASGTVEATEAQLGFTAPGRIEEISVREGDSVTAGQELAVLDRREMRARLEQAEAQIEAAGAVLAELERGSRAEEVAQARAMRDAAGDRMDDARRDLERAERLFDGGAVSRESLDKARTASEVAEKQYVQAEEQYRQVRTGPRKEKIAAQRAALGQAEANAAAVRATLSNMVVRAPFDGIVSVRHRDPGEIVPAGSPVVTVLDPADRWVRIFVPEYRIAAVHLGTPASITTDTYEDRVYDGSVSFIASEAEFTPKTVQTTEERVRLVYAVKVRITGDDSFDLKPGMPADIRLDLE